MFVLRYKIPSITS